MFLIHTTGPPYSTCKIIHGKGTEADGSTWQILGHSIIFGFPNSLRIFWEINLPVCNEDVASAHQEFSVAQNVTGEYNIDCEIGLQ